MRTTDKFVFFFGKDDIYSNWHMVDFEYKGITFNCVEQFMMYSKAMLFNDTKTAAKILAEKSPGEQKKLGRDVSPFDEDVWLAKRMNIVTVGCREKFFQNPKLAAKLIQTGDRTLVEASPFDDIWGIKLAANDPKAEDPSKWRGLNLLGQALTTVREILVDHMSMKPPAAPSRKVNP